MPFPPTYFYQDFAFEDMSFYDPHRRRRLSSPLPHSPLMAGNPYYQNPLAAQHLGGIYGPPRPLGYSAAQLPPNDPRYIQPMVPQPGLTPTAHYLGAAQQAAAQPGFGGAPLGQPPVAGAYQNPYAQAHPGMAAGAAPIPGAAGVAQQGVPGSYPQDAAQAPLYNQNSNTAPEGHSPHHHHDEAVPPHRHKDKRGKKKKSKTRKFLEELLFGSAGAAILAEIESRGKQKLGEHTDRSIPNNPEQAPRNDPPPKGSAPGYLHGKGHFVPMHLEDMIQHFVHGNYKGEHTPDSGAQTGFLHPGGHFVPLGIAALAAGFKHTLDKHRREREGGGKSRDVPSEESDGSDYSDESETESEDDERDRHGGHRRDRKR